MRERMSSAAGVRMSPSASSKSSRAAASASVRAALAEPPHPGRRRAAGASGGRLSERGAEPSAAAAEGTKLLNRRLKAGQAWVARRSVDGRATIVLAGAL